MDYHGSLRVRLFPINSNNKLTDTHTSPAAAVLYYEAGKFIVEFIDGENSVAPGQACAFYDGLGEGSRLLGGGFIQQSQREPQAQALIQKLLQTA